ncbi:polyprenyl synthetase family protein, partial [Paenibacillus validus]|nr:polyprenyl synthetase family protein [Paenibacillus validus]
MSAVSSIHDYIQTQALRVEHELERSIPQEWSIPAALRESMMYSLMAGGKRLRPILVLASAEALGG